MRQHRLAVSAVALLAVFLPLRPAAASSAVYSSAGRGTACRAKASGSPPDGAITGYIQLVVGITSWNPGPVMKARNFAARSAWVDVDVRAATSTCI